MSRKVTLKVPVEMIVRDRDVRMLAAIDRRSKRVGAPVSVSIRMLAKDTDTSLDTARRALTSCMDEGFLTIRECRLDNGCQVENAYTVTPRGLAVLDSARETGLVE